MTDFIYPFAGAAGVLVFKPVTSSFWCYVKSCGFVKKTLTESK